MVSDVYLKEGMLIAGKGFAGVNVFGVFDARIVSHRWSSFVGLVFPPGVNHLDRRGFPPSDMALSSITKDWFLREVFNEEPD